MSQITLVGMRRLQVLLPDDELAEIQEIARRNRVTTAACQLATPCTWP